MAGANAIKRLTFLFKFGLIERAAKDCAVPCENPMYVSDGAPVTSRIY